MLPPLIVAILAILVLTVAIGLLMPYSVQRKFAKLGTLEGRSKGEILAAVGPPDEVSTDDWGQTTMEWHPRYFKITLLFDANEKCSRVSR
jgi:hypothetical protein